MKILWCGSVVVGSCGPVQVRMLAGEKGVVFEQDRGPDALGSPAWVTIHNPFQHVIGPALFDAVCQELAKR